MADPTTNYGWELPRDQGDSGAWGRMLNDVFADIDDVLAEVEAVAEEAMPREGGEFTGEVDILTARYQVEDLGSSLSGTVALNLQAANYFHGVMGGTVTLNITQVPPAPHFVGFILELTGSGNAVNWPPSVQWPGGNAPAAPASGRTNIYVLMTRDGGLTWRASLAMEAVS